MNNCFVYKWTELSTEMWYIGSRTAIGCHIDDGYICSSLNTVLPMILANPTNWIREILETGNVDDMLQLEMDLLICLDAANSVYSYNQHNNNGKWSFAGKHHSMKSKAKTSASLLKTIAEREGLHWNTGRVQTDESNQKRSDKLKGIPCPSRARSGIDNGQFGKSKPIINCPYCEYVGKSPNIYRFHFANCKKAPN